MGWWYEGGRNYGNGLLEKEKENTIVMQKRKQKKKKAIFHYTREMLHDRSKGRVNISNFFILLT